MYRKILLLMVVLAALFASVLVANSADAADYVTVDSVLTIDSPVYTSPMPVPPPSPELLYWYPELYYYQLYLYYFGW